MQLLLYEGERALIILKITVTGLGILILLPITENDEREQKMT